MPAPSCRMCCFPASGGFTSPSSSCYTPVLAADMPVFRLFASQVSNRQACVVRQRRERERFAVYVTVRDNNVDQALRVLKKKLQREGVFREMKNRRAYEKPSERRAREAAESTRRVRKLMRKRMEREGY